VTGANVPILVEAASFGYCAGFLLAWTSVRLGPSSPIDRVPIVDGVEGRPRVGRSSEPD